MMFVLKEHGHSRCGGELGIRTMPPDPATGRPVQLVQQTGETTPARPDGRIGRSSRGLPTV